MCGKTRTLIDRMDLKGYVCMMHDEEKKRRRVGGNRRVEGNVDHETETPYMDIQGP